MSRALDPSVKAALKHGNHRPVFDEISYVLVSGDALEIEFVGQSHIGEASFIRDGRAVGVSKLRLLQAFLVARDIFSRRDDETKEEVNKATAVMLLQDPEHLTAANTRKRFVDGLEGITAELRFVDNLLTGRLHRHTKSPTLWNHRRWLVSQTNVDLRDLKEVIFVSGERHPRNYYAWLHARFLVSSLVSSQGDVQEEIMQAVEDTKGWCFAHHNDISGWDFLLILLRQVGNGDMVSEVLKETLKRTETWGWRNESTWCFLRTAAALGLGGEGEKEEVRRVVGVLKGEVVERAEQWTMKFGS